MARLSPEVPIRLFVADGQVFIDGPGVSLTLSPREALFAANRLFDCSLQATVQLPGKQLVEAGGL